MAVNLSGRRVLPWEKVTDLPEGRTEKFIMRPAQEEDIPNLLSLYNKNCSTSLIKCQRDERIMRHELNRPLSFGFAARNRTIVETGGGDIAGYVEYITSPQGIRIREIAVSDGASLCEVCWFAVRKIREQNKAKINTSQGISFALGESHPVYDALEPELGKLVKPYAWYIRVPDLTRWLLHIKPLLDERLTRSVMAGFEGDLKLNFYSSQLKLSFVRGKLAEIQPYEPEDFFEGDAFLPDLTFIQLLFGYRTIEELNYARADCFWEKGEAAVLLPILFPKKPSNIIMVG
jgi:hypothetical protein